MKKELYIKLPAQKRVTDRTIRLGDLCELWCALPSDRVRFAGLVLLREAEPKKKNVISALTILSAVMTEAKGENLQVTLLGETDIVAEYLPPAGTLSSFVAGVKAALVSAIVFIGGAFAIMTFNNDAEVDKVFDRLYELLAGMPAPTFHVLHVAYALGLFLGISLFFNHVRIKSRREDPTPLEMQLCTYEKDMAGAIVDQSERKEA